MSTEATPVAAGTPAPPPAEDWVVTSDRQTARVEAERAKEEAAEELSKAASEMGKKGGEAAAAKRAAEAKEAKRQEKAEPEGDEPEPEKAAGTDKPLGKPRDDPRARMLEATRKEAEAKREAEAARREAAQERQERARLQAELEAARTGRKPEERAEPRQAEGKPSPDQFESYEEYLDARDAHNRKTWEAEQEARRHELARQDRVMGTLRGWKEAMLKAADADPTFVERTEWLPKTCQPSFTMPHEDPRRRDPKTWIADELVDNPESAPTLALHFSEHPEDFQRIAALQTPRQVTREMAKLVTSLAAAPTATSPGPSVSKARPPVKPVTGSPSTVGEPDPEKLSYDDYVAQMNARDRASRRR